MTRLGVAVFVPLLLSACPLGGGNAPLPKESISEVRRQLPKPVPLKVKVRSWYLESGGRLFLDIALFGEPGVATGSPIYEVGGRISEKTIVIAGKVTGIDLQCNEINPPSMIEVRGASAKSTYSIIDESSGETQGTIDTTSSSGSFDPDLSGAIGARCY